jgi:hypothetical protein
MKWTVSLYGHASTTVEVEADTAEEAAALAEGEAYVSLCHHCASDVEVGDQWDATFARGEDGTEADVEGWRDR